MTKKLYLLDASGFIFRAYHALPPLTRPDGTPVGAVMGFCNILYKLLSEVDATHIGIIFDTKHKNWRHNIYPAYKANRPPPPEDLIPQFEIIRDATRAFGFDPIELERFEADDLIARYACDGRDQGFDVTIVSSDKDLMQLIQPHIVMMDPIKNVILSDDAVMKKFGVTPDKVVDAQSLIGDSTDNIPGVPGIGPKTAADLINTYGDLDTILASTEDITKPKLKQSLIEFADQARMSRELVTLSCDADVPRNIKDLTKPHWDCDTLRDFLKENNFKTLLNRIGTAAIDTSNAGSQHTIEKENIIDFTQYKLINNMNELGEYIKHIKTTGFLAFDTETTHLTPAKADLVGISLCYKSGHACYIPVGHKSQSDQLFDDGAMIDQLNEKDVMDTLKPIMEDKSVMKIAHNAKYDLQFFDRHDINIQSLDDTMLMSYTLDGGSIRHGLDELSLNLLNHETIKFETVAGKKGNFAHVKPEDALNYAAEDADVTLALWHRLKPRLLAEKQVALYEQIERPLAPIIAGMESAGVKIDTDYLKSLENEFSLKANALEEEIYEAAEGRFLLSSPKQLGEVLFERLGLEGGKKTKSGQWATGADRLEKLATDTGHIVPTKILEWRQLTKLISTYTRALCEIVNPRTGRIHTSYNLAATTTGRLASNDPNVQNIPIRSEEGRKIRSAFISDADRSLISADYSQVELRLIAEIADVKGLKQAFLSGQDIHSFTARQVFDIPDSQDLPPEKRYAAKAINFGIIYGQSAFGLAGALNIGRGEAKDFIDAYFNRYPEIQTYMEDIKVAARANNYVETLFGRRCYINGINDKNPMIRMGAERQAINAPIQGSAADVIKMAMIAVDRANLDARMLLQVHDELILEVEDSKATQVAKQLTDIMESVVSLSIPLVAEAGIGKNWNDAH